MIYLQSHIKNTYKMINENTLIIHLTVKQFMELQKIDSMKPNVKVISSKEMPAYLKPKELANLIGWKLQTVYQNHHNCKIPGAKKISGRLLFDTNEILKWIQESNKVHDLDV